MGRRCSFLDLEKHFAVYKAYHGNPVNVLIHAYCVWPNFFFTLLFLYFTPPLVSLPPIQLCGLPLVFNLGSVVAAVYALLYISLDPRAGFVAANLCILCWVGSSALGSFLGFHLAWKVVVAAQSFSWILMFIGHGVFEGGTPAILNNTSPAYLTAPLFVLLEVMQKLFGYEPYPGFHANIHARVEAERKTWNLNKEKSS